MRHLYLQIYAAFVAIAVLCLVVAGISARVLNETPWKGPMPRIAKRLGAVLTEALPPLPASSRPAKLHAALAEQATRFDVALNVWSQEHEFVAGTHGRRLRPRPHIDHTHWIAGKQGGGLAIALPDGRWLTTGPRRPPPRHRSKQHLLVLALVLAVMAAGCYPLARRITRRIERLQGSVENWGAGDLTVRVPEQGRDEVGDLARSFNMAASRIEGLVTQQKRVLGNASHELRSPVARLRLAIELMHDDLSEEKRRSVLAEATRDTEELDSLIADVLLSARLDAVGNRGNREAVDLGAIAEEETRKMDGAYEGAPTVVHGDAATLRRLVRNLLHNAVQHGEGKGIEVSVQSASGDAILSVSDRGPGVPESEREHIFEAFHSGAPQSEGVGLGLCLVRQIATAHDGSVEHKDRAGGGAVFTVRLPAG